MRSVGVGTYFKIKNVMLKLLGLRMNEEVWIKLDNCCSLILQTTSTEDFICLYFLEQTLRSALLVSMHDKCAPAEKS